MKLIQKKLTELTPYPGNSRTHSAEQVGQIVDSINEFGFTNPLLIDESNGIIAGHGRLMAAKLLKMKEVPCVILEGLTDTQKKAYVIADNKLALNAGWDEELLVLELQDLVSLEFDIGVIGFGGFLDAEGLGDSDYTQTIETPIYSPDGEKPAVENLVDHKRTRELMAEIEEAGLPSDVRAFLEAAAQRHSVFNFKRIADFYAHSDAGVQHLMERSALVIIDFDQAIEEGFVTVTEEIRSLYTEENSDAE
jgi:hypothetical protein